jgi:hypothetical protein
MRILRGGAVIALVAASFGYASVGWTRSLPRGADPMPDATGYDVVKGDLGVLRGTNGDFTSAILACLADNLADTALVLSGSPATGAGFFYLVRGTNLRRWRDVRFGISEAGGLARRRDRGVAATLSMIHL